MKNPLKLWLDAWSDARLERRHYCKSWPVGESGVARFMVGYREVPRRLMVSGPATAQIVSIMVDKEEVLCQSVPALMFSPQEPDSIALGDLNGARHSIEVALTGGPATVGLVVDKTTERKFWKRLAVTWRLFLYYLSAKDEDDEEADS